MENRKRNIQMKFYVTEEEKRLIDEKMKQLPIKQYTLIFKKMELRYGKKALDEVRCLQSDEIDYKHDPNAPKLPELQIEIWNAMEHADDKCYENSFKIKLARYELRESFERLIDSLYPR